MNPITKTINEIRSLVFKRAYHIMRNTAHSFSVCLSKAWRLYRLSKKMNAEREVCFTYEKKDGTFRRAYGTLLNTTGMIPNNTTTKSISDKVFRYWDTEQGAYRCFKVEKLIAIF